MLFSEVEIMRVETEYEVEHPAISSEILWTGSSDHREFVINTKEGYEMELVGGKAFNISILAGEESAVSRDFRAKEFTIPDGVCITTEAYDLFCEKNGLNDKITRILASINYEDTNSIEKASKMIRKIILEAETPEEVLEELSTITYENIIVRSSANLEDLPEASFAGQQETYVNPQNLLDAVKSCWASLWTGRALSYRHSRAIKKVAKMAVIVQELIPCDVSGVIFTANPVNCEDEIVVEAVFGLGESLVSGEVDPDRYVLDSRLNLKKKEICAKKHKVVLTETGTQKVKCEPGECLTKEMLEKIGEISVRIENLFQEPQDIEFGIYEGQLYIFQSRSITTKKEDIWTRGYSDDYWTGVTSPLFFSLLGEFLEIYANKEVNAIMGFTELKDIPALKYHKAHVYFNTRALKEFFKYSPKFSRVKELLDYFPEDQREEIKELPFNVWKRILAEFRIALFDWDGTLFNTCKKYDEFSEKYLEKIKKFDRIDLETLSDSELLEQYQYLYSICLKHYRLARWGINSHMGMNMILKRLIISWYCEDPDRTHNVLVSGLPHNKATETNIALFNLVKTKRKGQNFERELSRFLEEYGHRSYSRDIVFPTWSEDPNLVLDIVDSLIENDRDVQQIEAEKKREREELTKKVLKEIGNQKFGLLKKQIFKTILSYAQKYIAFRENQRFSLDHQNSRFRRLFLEMGRRLEERGILEAVHDVFFLFKEEIFEAMESGKVDLELLERRKKDFKEYREKLPPKFLQGNTEFDEDVVRGKKICGTASGPGIVGGRVRLIRNIHELGKIRKGEIMVVTCTDPGWTPVFLKIKGLITETGGILSHGAVVSREYGIPAVTGVKNAMKTLKDGDAVILDGNTGTVYVK